VKKIRVYLDFDNVHPLQLLLSLLRLKRKFPYLSGVWMHIYRTRREEVQPWHYHFNFQVEVTNGTADGGFSARQVVEVTNAAYGVDFGYKWFTRELDGQQTLRRSIKRVAGVRRNPAPVYYCSLTPDDRLVYLRDRRQTDLTNYMQIEKLIDKD